MNYLIPKAWCEERNEMLKVISINFEDEFIRALTTDGLNDYEASYSFRGLKILYPIGHLDINKNLIYEGDILEYDRTTLGYEELPTGKYLVEVGRRGLEIEILEHTNPFMFRYEFDNWSDHSFLEGFEIVGNVHENRLLLDRVYEK